MTSDGGKAQVPARTVAFWIVASVVSSVSIILCNKAVFKTYRFRFVMTLTAAHFLMQCVLLEVLAATGGLVKKHLELRKRLGLAALTVGSVSLMNINLKVNSVSVYQISKLVCIPFMVVITYAADGVWVSRRIAVILGVVLFGVALTSVSDIEATVGGSLLALLAAFVTALLQWSVGRVANAEGLSPAQITHSVSLPMFVLQLVAAAALEFGAFEEAGAASAETPLTHTYAAPEVVLLMLSCLMAVAVNVAAAGVIKNTSSVTYQVVGHAKTCILLASGYVFFASDTPMALMLKQWTGVAVALTGVYLYGKAKTGSSQTIFGSLCDCLLAPGSAAGEGYELVAAKAADEADQEAGDDVLGDEEPRTGGA